MSSPHPGLVPGVSALVVSYHTGPRLLECLYALKSDPAVSEIIIADNGNPPQVRDWLQGFASRGDGQVRVLRLPNPGFGAAVNHAALEARFPFLLVINPDCVLRRGSVEALMAAIGTQAGPCLAGGRIFGTDGREQRGARRNPLTLVRALGLGRWTLETDPIPPGPVPVGAVSGAFFLMRRADFAALGGFDEGYFLHVEDVDLCQRVLAAGGRVLYQPEAGALHYSSTSDLPAREVRRHKARSLARYLRRHARSPAERCLVEAAVPFIGLALRLHNRKPRRGAGASVRRAARSSVQARNPGEAG